VRAIRFLGSILATTLFIRSTSATSSTFGSLSSTSFEGLHRVHLLASNLYGYIEHTHEVSHVNGAIDALSIGPSACTSCFFVLVHVSFLFMRVVVHTCTYMSSNISHYSSGLN
jgi:hypothetical protein